MCKIDKNQIEKYLKEKGYYNTNIRIIQRDDPEHSNFVILDAIVEKHNKIKIDEIIITGNKLMKDGRLKGAMKKTKEKSLRNFFKSANYIEKNYTNHSIIKDTTEIFVRYNNPYKYKNILINKLTNIESPFKPFPDNDTIGWSITKDINTSFRDDGLSKKFVLDLYSKIKDYLCS